jgi:hypothetical protein
MKTEMKESEAWKARCEQRRNRKRKGREGKARGA